jgi:hypothetical protein
MPSSTRRACAAPSPTATGVVTERGADHPAENGAPQAREAFTVRPQAARQPGVRIQIGVDADQPEGRARPTWAKSASGSKRRNRKKATASPVLYDLM